MSPRLMLEHGGTSYSATLDEEPRLVATLDESAVIALHIAGAEPDVEYRLSVGTQAIDAENEVASALGEHVYWRAQVYLESARGRTVIRVESREPGGAWRARGGLVVDVVPAKIGEAQYRALFDELRTLSPALVYDVHGKSGRSASRAASDALSSAWRSAEHALQRLATSVSASPARMVTHARLRRTMAFGRAHDAGRAMLLERQLDVAERPVYRRIAAALDRLITVTARMADNARGALAEIERDRGTTSVRVRGRSLYDIVDEPRVTRLEHLRAAVGGVHGRVRQIRESEPFARARSLEAGGLETTSLASGPAQHALLAVRRALLAAREAEAGGSYIRPTSRLYEVWVFLRIARALAAATRSHESFETLLAQLRTRRFGAGLPRGTTLTFELFDQRQAVLTFEPAIHTRPQARMLGAPFCREDVAAAPLLPDILLVVHNAAQQRVIVLDAKYANVVRPAMWESVERYFGLRHTASGRSARASLWIVAPVPTRHDASNRDAAIVPAGWRGGFLPLVPGSAEPHAFLPAHDEPHTFGPPGTGAAGSRGRHSPARRDGTDTALRAFVSTLLYE